MERESLISCLPSAKGSRGELRGAGVKRGAGVRREERRGANSAEWRGAAARAHVAHRPSQMSACPAQTPWSPAACPMSMGSTPFLGPMLRGTQDRAHQSDCVRLWPPEHELRGPGPADEGATRPLGSLTARHREHVVACNAREHACPHRRGW